MSLSISVFLATAFCLLRLLPSTLGGIVVGVNCTSSERAAGCVHIDEALQKIGSHTVLWLRSGNHEIHEFVFHRSLDNVSFVGLEKALEVRVTCKEGVGLAFFNVSNLQFRNVTIEGCGLSNSSDWKTVLDEISEVIEPEIIQIPLDVPVKVALFLANCENVTLENVDVVNTTGIGMLAVNAMGSIQLNSVRFEHNVPAVCTLFLAAIPLQISDFRTWIGGGAYFVYEDYAKNLDYFPRFTRLSVTNSRFLNNQDCGVVGSTEQFIEFSTTIQQTGYYIGASGGLSVMMAQIGFPVEVVVQSTVFSNNLAKFGGAVHIGVFAGSSNNHIKILNCTFDTNGNGSMFAGGALTVFFDLWTNSRFDYDRLEVDQTNVTLEVIDTDFSRNVAYAGGAVFLFSHYANELLVPIRVLFYRCKFNSNSAAGGAALLVFESKEGGHDQGMQVELRDTEISNNSVFSSSLISPDNALAGAVTARAVKITISGNSRFQDNSGSAFVAVRSVLNLDGNIIFSNNKAFRGGALYLLDLTFLVIQRNTRVLFDNNEASLSGGALYVELYIDEFRYGYDDCFLYFEEINGAICTPDGCPHPTDLNISIVFQSNVAPSGSAIFGSTLETCPWIVNVFPSRPEPDVSILQLLNNYTTLMTFDLPPVGRTQVSTPSKSIEVDEEYVEVMPGQEFTVTARVSDRFDQPVVDGITSDTRDISVANLGDSSRARLGDSGFWLVDPMSSETPVTVTGDKNHIVTVLLHSTDSSAYGQLTVVLTACLAGFVYDNDSMSCVCETRLLDRDVVCNVNTQEHKVPEHVWYGPIDDYVTNHTQDINDKLVVHSCVLGYCRSGEKSVLVGNYKSQCAEDYHRDSFLCSRCEEGYSVQLGSYRCGKCTNFHLFILAFFVIAGVLIVVAMASLHITVTEGYLYSVLFYSNIVDTFIVEFCPGLPASGVFVISSMFSLNLGFEACLYDGMDSLARIGARVLFIGYLLVIILFIYLTARVKVLIHDYSPVKILTTLMILSYIATLQICVSVLSGTRVETLDGSAEIRWYIDPTVPYFMKAHGLLAALSVALVTFYIIPFPILGLFPKKVYNWSCTRKFKPFFDALWAPFKMKYRYWLGVRLILRWVTFGFSYFNLPPHNLLALGLLLVVLLSVQTKIQPFQGFWQNLIDDCLVANLIILTLGTLYFRAIEGDGGSTSQVIFSAVVASLGYGIFLGVFVRHLFLRFPHLIEHILHLPTKIKESFKGNAIEEQPSTSAKHDVMHPLPISAQEAVEMCDIWQSEHLEKGDRKRSDATGSEVGSPRVITFTELREPLLEDSGEIEVSTSSKTVGSLNSSAFTGRSDKTPSIVNSAVAPSLTD